MRTILCLANIQTVGNCAAIFLIIAGELPLGVFASFKESDLATGSADRFLSRRTRLGAATSDSSSSRIVAMVQAAQPRHRHHATVSDADGGLPPARSFLLQPEMSSVIVVITHVFG